MWSIFSFGVICPNLINVFYLDMLCEVYMKVPKEFDFDFYFRVALINSRMEDTNSDTETHFS